MNPKSLSNHDLETSVKNKVALERKTTVEIISLLEEIADRKIYLQRGFGSLIEYCIKDLGYSESSAYRRVAMVHLAKDVPAIKESVASGKLSLVTVAKAQSVFQSEAKKSLSFATDEKIKILQRLENVSTRTAEKILLEVAPHPLPPERVREMDSRHTQISVTLSEDVIQKLESIKNLWSHKNSTPSYAELIEMLADHALKARSSARARVASEKSLAQRTQSATSAGVKRSHIPQNVRENVWQKARGQCQYIDVISRRKCESRFQLQIEHVRPIAKGGENNFENLELLCGAHNRWRAIQHFGNKKPLGFHQRAHKN